MISLRSCAATLIGLVVWVPAQASADTYPRQPGVDALHYLFRLAITDASKEIAGETTVTLKLVADGLRDIELDLMPTIDHPYDKATGEFVVTAPAQYQVVANGLLIEELDLPGARRQTHWKQSVPISSWLFAPGVARFSVHHAGLVKGVELQTWAFPQEREKSRSIFEDSSRRAMTFFVENIGPYPYEELANVQAAGMSGGTGFSTSG